IRHIFADYEHFSSRVTVLPKMVGEAQQMIPTQMDPPVHRPYRMLLNDTLAPKTVNAMEDRVRECASQLVESVRAAGRCNFTKAYAEIFPIQIFMKIVDLPFADAEKMKHWSDQFIRPDGSMPIEVA